MNLIDVLKEFTELLPKLNEHNVRYAVVGGLAVNIYAQVRATRDIDFLIHEDDIDLACQIAEDLGYIRKDDLIPFHSVNLELQRLLKKVDDDFMILDFLIAHSDEDKKLIDQAEFPELSFGKARVISKEGLIQMKRKAARPQDLADLEKLEQN